LQVRAVGTASVIQDALNPSGGCLKQIDPAHPLPVHGFPV
jgi:hypothetical protein